MCHSVYLKHAKLKASCLNSLCYILISSVHLPACARLCNWRLTCTQCIVGTCIHTHVHTRTKIQNDIIEIRKHRNTHARTHARTHATHPPTHPQTDTQTDTRQQSWKEGDNSRSKANYCFETRWNTHVCAITHSNLQALITQYPCSWSLVGYGSMEKNRGGKHLHI